MPTRIGLISDVHSSPDPLQQALDIFEREGVDDIICAGDIAGYFETVAPTIELLAKSNCKAVVGNHDQSYLEKPLREDLASFTVDGLPPWLIRDGTGMAANEWLPVSNPQPQQALDFEILPFEEMPQLVNPARGYIANANSDQVGATLDNVPFNQVRPSGTGLYYLGAYYWSYRMGRVDRELGAMIDSGVKVGPDDMKTLQADVRLMDAELVLPTLMQIMSQVPVPPGSPMEQALDVLSDWDYTANTGIAEGWDAGDDPLNTTEPTEQAIARQTASRGCCWAYPLAS